MPDRKAPDLEKLSHTRWLTIANATVRKFIEPSNPSNLLKMLTEYVMRVYVPICGYSL